MTEPKKEEAAETKTTLSSVANMTGERDAALVVFLEKQIELVKEGDVSDIVVIMKVRGEPATEMDWESEDPMALIGAIEMAKVEITMQHLDELNGVDDDDDDD